MWPVVLGVLVAVGGVVVLAAGLTKRGTGPRLAEPGWYADPSAPGQIRWFDGRHWTAWRGTGPPTGSLDP
jgi:hypothetical protein